MLLSLEVDSNIIIDKPLKSLDNITRLGSIVLKSRVLNYHYSINYYLKHELGLIK